MTFGMFEALAISVVSEVIGAHLDLPADCDHCQFLEPFEVDYADSKGPMTCEVGERIGRARR
jgi:hypothetical protein